MNITDFNQWLFININTNGVQAITGAKMYTALSSIMAYVRAEKRMEAAVAITANTSNIITFKDRADAADPFPVNTVYALPKPRVYDADGNNLDFIIFDMTVNGFKITPVEDGFIDYEAIEIKQTTPE